ncbi:MAG: PKD domain-containing protein, partial [Gammaproteobacteria bacterium]|nr:PKD domain-containing protein [Gammaproteobacteria bacterium]
PLVYHWNFGGAAPNMTGQSPGAVIFSTPGVYMVSLVVADSTGVMDPTPDYRTVTVVGNPVNPGFNQPPQGMIISPATDTQIPVGGSVNFMANGTDPENNTPLAYRWDFGGATSARTTQNPGQVTFNTPGTYYVTLTVSDSLGAFDPTPETRVIRVGSSFGGGVVGGINNLAPESLIVQPTTDQTISVGQSVVFAGQGNDPELDTQLIYRWDFDGAMPSTLVQNPGAVTFSQPGSYRIRLAVSDSQGATDATPAVRNITVVGNGNTFNQPPNGVIIDPSINMSISVGQSLSFSAIGNDPEGSLLTYTWDFGGQIPNETGQVTSPITFNRAGVYRVTLIARDDQGARDATPDMRVITVIGNSAAQPPVASIASPVTDITINQGSSVNFYGTGSRLGSFTTPLTYRWEVTGGFVSIPNANVASPGLINFPTAGVYNVKFTVSDGLASDSVTRKVTVLGQSTNPPTATITATSSLPGVGTVPVGSQMQFNGTAFGGFAPYTYMWNFDGAVADSSLQNPSVTFNRPGAYDIKLYVTDSQGVRSLASAAYRVTVGNGSIGVIPAPQIVTNPQILNTINVGQTVNFSAFSSGGFGAGQVYRWNFDGAVPNSLAQNPGNVTFNRVGTYYITLKVSDQSGATSSPATLAVNVVSNGSFGSPFPGTGQGTGTGTINAVIQSPSSNVAINCGVPFTFQAANLGASVSYNWTIKNGATTELTRNGLNLSSLNATFYKAGSYTVELTASSNIGSDLTPDIRNFQVVNNGSCTGGAISSGSFGSGVGTGVGTGVGQAPNGNITSPVSDLTLRKGQSLNFVAQSFDPTGAQGAGAWDFGTLSVGTTVNPTALNAGSVVFNQTGVFVIRFTARNSSGVSDPTPSIRVITVLP